MGSRSDACRSDAEGYPHLMASTATGAASRGARLSQRNSGTRALGDAGGAPHDGTRQHDRLA